MAHVRQSIRDNIVTAVTGLSTTGSNVFRLIKDERIANLQSPQISLAKSIFHLAVQNTQSVMVAH